MAKISHSQLSKLFRRLATGYGAGIDIVSIYTRETETGSPAYRAKARAILGELRQGKSLDQSMRSVGDYFPPLATSIVAAGEKGGRLEDAMERLADHYEKLVRFRNSFLLSIAWPAFELSFAIFIVGALILLLGTLASPESANWFGMGSPLANFLFYVFCVALILGTAALLFMGTRNGWFGTFPMRVARHIPLVGRTIEALALSRMAWTMAISENAGMDALDIASTSLESTQNHYYTCLQEPVCRSIRGGSDFTSALGATQAFPDDFLIYVENGELAGELAESMDRASRELETRAENNMKLLGTIGFVLTFLFVAAVIGTLVITMLQKFYIDPINQMLDF